MKDENVYRKMDNGRYAAYGVCCEPSNLPDGIWYVRHKDHSHAITSVPYMQGLFKMGNAKQVDVTEICGMEDLCDYIMDSKEWREMMNDENGHTLNDLVHLCVAKIVEKSKEND